MPRKIVVGLLLIIFFSLAWAGLQAAAGGTALQDKSIVSIKQKAEKGTAASGTFLLDKFILTFRQMAEKGTGGRNVLFPAFDAMMTEAKQAKSEGAIDGVFLNRYQRLLMMCKLWMIEDPAGILGPLIEREIAGFIWEVRGERVDNAAGKSSIGLVAAALADEVINLQLYLDNQKERARLEEKFGLGPGPVKR